MPELIEVERYRRLAAGVLGRRIAAVEVDALAAAPLPPAAVVARLVGRTPTGTRRVGKLLLVDLDDGGTLGLRFGMTGRLLLDGVAGLDDLRYGSNREDPRWDRFRVDLADGGVLVVRDPRRLGRVELDPDVTRLGPDAADIGVEALARACAGTTTALKARLLDQAHVAGLGNLLVDEVCWRARIDPARPAGDLGRAELVVLARTIRATIAELDRRGGSHLGDLQPARDGRTGCPRCGGPVQRRRIGGRTTVSCPTGQR